MKIFYKKYKIRLNFFLILILLYNHVNAQISILTANTSWKYLDNGSNPGTSWKTASFNDALWKTGNAELGFGDAPVTIITSGRIGYHFRKIVSTHSFRCTTHMSANMQNTRIVEWNNTNKLLRR